MHVHVCEAGGAAVDRFVDGFVYVTEGAEHARQVKLFFFLNVYAASI